MGLAIVPLSSPARLTCAVALGCVLGARLAMAFPATDPSNPSIVANPPEPTESDMRHQLQLQSGVGAAAGGGGWTFTPSLGGEEYFTDNVLNTSTNRRWDLVTVVTPGIAILGDTPNAQVQLNYAPQGRLNARTPEENDVVQQLNGTGLFTIIPDTLFVDARASAGGTPVAPGFGAQGPNLTPTFGQINNGTATEGLSKQNTAQTSSESISPYLLHRFGDIGTVKIGYEFNQSTISQDSGDLPLFFPTGNVSQHQTTNQGVAQFETGEAFAPYRNLIVANVSQSTGTGVANGSSEDTIKNQLGYAINHQWSIYGELGYEKLRFGGVPPTNVDDMVWGFGATYSPNTDSQITLGYGHENGETGVQFAGYYALSPRTRISARYSTGLQTDLQQLQSQLDLTALDQNGNAVDAQTGAPLFNGLSGLGVQGGLFRAKNLSVTASTILDRDSISASLDWTQNMTIAADNAFVASSPFNPTTPPVGSTSEGVTAIVSWQHQINESLSLNSSASYGVTNTSGGPVGTSNSRQTSVGANVGLQYLLSETLVTYARYSYFERGSSVPGQAIYQNLVLVGINKQF